MGSTEFIFFEQENLWKRTEGNNILQLKSEFICQHGKNILKIEFKTLNLRFNGPKKVLGIMLSYIYLDTANEQNDYYYRDLSMIWITSLLSLYEF